MFDAVEAGEEAAVRFYADHVTEVKAHVLRILDIISF